MCPAAIISHSYLIILYASNYPLVTARAHIKQVNRTIIRYFKIISSGATKRMEVVDWGTVGPRERSARGIGRRRFHVCSGISSARRMAGKKQTKSIMRIENFLRCVHPRRCAPPTCIPYGPGPGRIQRVSAFSTSSSSTG